MDRRVARLIKFIDSNGGAVGWNLEYACRELNLGISPAYAARLFRVHAGIGIREYTTKRRLLMATKRLKSTRLPVKVIAIELGYRRIPHFTRFFKQQQLLPPAQFRREPSPTSQS
jgi:AraC-like DNA-binding protein